jgi:hypothetical protein
MYTCVSIASVRVCGMRASQQAPLCGNRCGLGLVVNATYNFCGEESKHAEMASPIAQCDLHVKQ